MSCNSSYDWARSDTVEVVLGGNCLGLGTLLFAAIVGHDIPVSRLSGFKAPVNKIVDSVALSVCVLGEILFRLIVCGCVCWILSHIIVCRWCVYTLRELSPFWCGVTASGFKAPVKTIVDSVALIMCVLDVFLFHLIVCGCVCWFLSHIIVCRWCVY